MSFTFNGGGSSNYGFNVTKRSVYSAPAYDVLSEEVVGRSGNVLIPQGRFKNKKVSYTGFLIADTFAGLTKADRLSNGLRRLKSWLLGNGIAGQYKKLTDDYDPGFSRFAYVAGETSISDIQDRPEGAELTITFDCQPFLYAPSESYSGSSPITLDNPYSFESNPEILLALSSSTGTMKISKGATTLGTWTFTGASGDRFYWVPEDMEWVDYSDNLVNNKVTTNGSNIPYLPTGSSKIELTGIGSFTIYPNWRTL